ncbi:MAG: KH domain-containing protein [Nitrososphaerota archaeon]|jgi:ribosomal RNA assembly protein|uniref:KH domain-containing protein n=1 Tax=Candidatus Bathycorpusculum sp. TaxID=2994959 RepID=UPI0028376500|nr:KH domain-containing protein [Candidatus Termiticorpusculum sp.]MCL2257763.1 KH domain-containing protein [Candidatus Termiticorpusculum sp.]MCL2292090.1 KH domain-containing protein [Candidatus Termiticorpusculum sp.]MDR0460139.1 KH domain-containing protein [Nitrososphaerota archaeon]
MPNLDTFIRIPKDRIGILVGPEGKTKVYIEDRLKIKLEIDSEDGGITIVLTPEQNDPSMLLRAKDLITAIGRGFAPEVAYRLIRNEDDVFDLIDMRLVFGRSESDIKRIKGRIIGAEGKTRRLIEELTEADVTVYGHTIGIIGNYQEADAARNAIQMIIDGCEHKTVYKYLQRKRTEMKKEKMQLWETPVKDR